MPRKQVGLFAMYSNRLRCVDWFNFSIRVKRCQGSREGCLQSGYVGCSSILNQGRTLPRKQVGLFVRWLGRLCCILNFRYNDSQAVGRVACKVDQAGYVSILNQGENVAKEAGRVVCKVVLQVTLVFPNNVRPCQASRQCCLQDGQVGYVVFTISVATLPRKQVALLAKCLGRLRQYSQLG